MEEGNKIMTDLRAEFTPERESDGAADSSMIFKTVAALIVALMLGVLGAYYYFGPGMSNEPTTRVALVSPPQTPLKPVIAPQMVTPAPQAALAPTTEAKSADTSKSAATPTHARRHVQQSAEVQPAPAAPAAAEPVTSPALTAPTPPLPEAPAQPAVDPTQPSPQP
jgi:cytoskeletal protein RodZ